MPKWININEKQPERQQNYYVKISGRKDIFNLHRLLQYKNISDDAFWLDESIDDMSEIISVLKEKDIDKVSQFKRESVAKALDLGKKNTKIDVVEKVNNNQYLFSLSELEILFGIKGGKKMQKLLFNIKDSKIKNKKHD